MCPLPTRPWVTWSSRIRSEKPVRIDLVCEDALYGSANLRRFVGIDLGRESVPV